MFVEPTKEEVEAMTTEQLIELNRLRWADMAARIQRIADNLEKLVLDEDE